MKAPFIVAATFAASLGVLFVADFATGRPITRMAPSHAPAKPDAIVVVADDPGPFCPPICAPPKTAAKK